MAGASEDLFTKVSAAVIALLGVGCILFEPREIFLDSKGITQSSLLTARRRITWKMAAASYQPRLQEVLVVGSDGCTITHSRYHLGQQEFLCELEEHGVFVQRGI